MKLRYNNLKAMSRLFIGNTRWTQKKQYAYIDQPKTVHLEWLCLKIILKNGNLAHSIAKLYHQKERKEGKM
jgi:hypothetical protein